MRVTLVYYLTYQIHYEEFCNKKTTLTRLPVQVMRHCICLQLQTPPALSLHSFLMSQVNHSIGKLNLWLLQGFLKIYNDPCGFKENSNNTCSDLVFGSVNGEVGRTTRGL